MNRKESKHRPGTATLEKGRVRLIAILEAARQVFMRHGYAGFTMRKVAAEAGISVGNLHYYYRNKEDLLRDMLDYVVSHYLEEFDNRMKLAGDAPTTEVVPWVAPSQTRGAASELAVPDDTRQVTLTLAAPVTADAGRAAEVRVTGPDGTPEVVIPVTPEALAQITVLVVLRTPDPLPRGAYEVEFRQDGQVLETSRFSLVDTRR